VRGSPGTGGPPDDLGHGEGRIGQADRTFQPLRDRTALVAKQPPELRARELEPVDLRDPRCFSDRFRDREVGDAAPVRETSPLQRDRSILAAAEELSEQARFPDAGGPECRNDPAPPVRTCLKEGRFENVELRLPAHER
jgi:hypothetical protein